jgi:anti-sigma factor RsiW
MTEHLTESLLNEYLDGALDPSGRQRVEVHLVACPECRAREEQLKRLFEALAGLTEQPLAHDLVSYVLPRLPRTPTNLAWKLVLAVQSGFTIALLILIGAPLASRLASTFTWLTSQVAISLVSLPRMVPLLPPIPTMQLPRLPAVHLPVSFTPGNSGLWLVLGIAAGLLFLIGNFSLIFLKQPRDRK